VRSVKGLERVEDREVESDDIPARSARLLPGGGGGGGGAELAGSRKAPSAASLLLHCYLFIVGRHQSPVYGYAALLLYSQVWRWRHDQPAPGAPVRMAGRARRNRYHHSYQKSTGVVESSRVVVESIGSRHVCLA